MTDAGPTEWSTGAPGVGPWAGELPDDPRYDQELLREGDSRNVVDAYRYWKREAIVADIDARRHPVHVAIENFAHDANIGTVVRTANAFAVAAVHIVGRRRWNRRGLRACRLLSSRRRVTMCCTWKRKRMPRG